MSATTDLLETIRGSESGLTLAELLGRHPSIARRTAQRLIAKLIESGHITAQGEGRARRYHADSESHTEPRIAKVCIFRPIMNTNSDST